MRPAAALIILLAPFALLTKDHPDERLKSVSSIFVSGNNQAAEGARQAIKNGKTCFVLADKAVGADATLEIANENQSMGGHIGALGGRSSVVSGTLTLSTGELVWSRSEQASDAPMMSGAKTAGNLLVRHLADEAACKQRSR